jgi:PST family polysaccharide transporter
MVAMTMASLTLVLVRTMIVRQGGLADAGLYQAAYSISAVNVSLVLAAMAADYFPRLAAVEKDREASNRLINHQLRSIMLMGVPILIATVALAPWVTQILYSSAFRPAAGMLMWQVTGELLKFPVWTLGFLLLARRDNSRFFLTESLFVTVYVAGSYLLFPLIGLTGVGLAYLGAYCTDAIVLLVLCRVRHGVVLSAANLWFLGASLTMLVALVALAQVRPGIASVVGLTAAVLLAAYAVREFGLAGSVWSRLAPRPRAPE